MKRRQYLTDKEFQLGFIFKFCIIVIFSSLIIGVLVFFLTRNSTTLFVDNTQVSIKATANYILPVLILTVVVVAFFSTLVLSVMALIISHRIVGPLSRLRKGIDVLKDGDFTKDFHVRNKDNLKDLAESLTEMSGELRSKHVELKKKSESLKEFLKERNYSLSFEDKARFLAMLEEIDGILRFFKV